MLFRKLQAKPGDTLRVSDLMSLRFEKISDDLGPIWHEIPATDETLKYDEGNFVEVTEDCWFVFDRGHWRMMSVNEHTEATRQAWLSSQSPGDFGQL